MRKRFPWRFAPSALKAGKLLLIAALALPLAAHAQSCTATATSVNFGNVSPIAGTAVSANGTLNISCTWPAVTATPNAQVCLNLNASAPRYLLNGANRLAYDLYTDAAHMNSWGSGTAAIAIVLTKPLVGTTNSTTATMYGQVTADQPLVPSVGNSSTSYAQTFTGALTSLKVGFYLVNAPSCSSLSATAGTFAFTASAIVVNNCTLSATNVTFGTATTLTSALTANGQLGLVCTNGDAYKLSLSPGGSGTALTRTLAGSTGTAKVSYQLYADSARSQIWGDGTNGTVTNTGVGTGLPQTVTIYGAVPTQPTPAPGNYTDSITATVAF